ncbi:GNAT family N-acetyltransferase [Neptunitalea lumnitzerae]|uniref:ElaA protein n=1 Tax=Neptunitalea lumnitzerae TaxID=2965509 RepID=A0ABQ5MFM0_9FLAO|nr:GNAT family N-acetyltransferase [Neptunitalea sp. Y10]GLB48183.1 ElaA protein [Neptunitalea sp. Y10]
MNIYIKSFEELTIHELYDLLRLRSEVFVVEQDCVYQDIDEKDQKAFHLLGVKEGKVIAYTRIFKPGDYFENASIGRVVVQQNQRTYGYGHDIMKASLTFILNSLHEKKVKISAQEYLKKFYQSHGFTQVGEGYLEDGIPHIGMIYEP